MSFGRLLILVGVILLAVIGLVAYLDWLIGVAFACIFFGAWLISIVGEGRISLHRRDQHVRYLLNNLKEPDFGLPRWLLDPPHLPEPTE